jgi:hypothetical protein
MIMLIGLGVSVVVGLIVFLIIRRKWRKATNQPTWHLRKKNNSHWYV